MSVSFASRPFLAAALDAADECGSRMGPDFGGGGGTDDGREGGRRVGAGRSA